jgi:hypothetical protein
MIWVFLILGLPLPVWLMWQADTPEYFFQVLFFTLLSGIPIVIIGAMIYDWVAFQIRRIRNK